MEINVHYEFICEVDGVYMFWVSWGDGGKMVQLTEEDLQEKDDP